MGNSALLTLGSGDGWLGRGRFSGCRLGRLSFCSLCCLRCSSFSCFCCRCFFRIGFHCWRFSCCRLVADRYRHNRLLNPRNLENPIIRDYIRKLSFGLHSFAHSCKHLEHPSCRSLEISDNVDLLLMFAINFLTNSPSHKSSNIELRSNFTNQRGSAIADTRIYIVITPVAVNKLYESLHKPFPFSPPAQM